MSSPKISYELWVAMGAEVRTAFLEKNTTEKILELLEDVHPELRVADLESKEWRDLLQRGYEMGLSIGKSRADTIDTLRSEVSSYGDYLQTMHPNEATLRVARQDRQFEQIITHEAYVPHPAYNVYNVLRDIEGSVLRLFIQPVDDKNPNEYQKCITPWHQKNTKYTRCKKIS